MTHVGVYVCGPGKGAEAAGPSFASVLKDAIGSVAENGSKSDAQTIAMASGKANVKDTTPFQASGSWQQNTTTYKALTFTVDMFSQDARILNEMISPGAVGNINISGGIIVCSLYWDQPNGKRFQFYALPTGLTTTVAANDVDKQQVQMSATGPVYEVTSNTFSTATVIQM